MLSRLSIENFVSFVDFIKDFATRHPLLLHCDFLLSANINFIEKHATNYENRSLLPLKENLNLLNEAALLAKKNRAEWTISETKTILISYKIKKLIEYNVKAINDLNDTTNNRFIQLINFNPSCSAKIECIHSKWEKRSHFAEVPSEYLSDVSKILDRFAEYSEMISKNTEANMFSDLKRMVKALNVFIDRERKLLSLSMLARLTLAKDNVVDNVVLATLDELHQLGLGTVCADRIRVESQVVKLIRICLKHEIPIENCVIHAKNENALNDALERLQHEDKGIKKEIADELKKGMLQNKLTSDLCFYFETYIKKYGAIKQQLALNQLYDSFNLSLENPPVLSDDQLFKKPLVLNGVHWLDIDFSSIVQQGAQFCECHFDGSHFISADLRLSVFTNSCFRNANLTNANLDMTDLSNVVLQWAYGLNATFNYAQLQHTSFYGAYLSKAKFQHVTLGQTDFRSAKLMHANFYQATGSCNFDEANLSFANLVGVDLRYISMNNTILTGIQFFDALHLSTIQDTLNIFSANIKNHANFHEIILAATKDIINQAIKMDNMRDALEILDITTEHKMFGNQLVYVPASFVNVSYSVSMFFYPLNKDTNAQQTNYTLLQTAKENIYARMRSTPEVRLG